MFLWPRGQPSLRHTSGILSELLARKPVSPNGKVHDLQELLSRSSLV